MTALRRGIPLLALGAVAWSVCAEPLQLRIEREPDARLARLPGKTPAFGAADKVTGTFEERIVLEGRARLRQGPTSVAGERIEYVQSIDTLSAEGAVRVVRGGQVVEGPRLQLQVEAQIGAMEDASFVLPAFGGSGSAQRIEFDGPGRLRLLGAMFTTCRPDQPDWMLVSEKVVLDEHEEWGKAESASVRFGGLSIPAIPSVSFPLSEKRRSGWLPPSFGATTRTGFELSAPYYLNLAPERDLTLYPRISLLQGVSLGAWGRYLDHSYRGDTKLEFNPKDLRTGDLRYQWSSLHRFQDWSGWSGQWDLRGVSDDQYLVDYGRTILGASVRSLPRVISASRAVDLPWLGIASLTLLSASYQNVLDARVSPPTNCCRACRSSGTVSGRKARSLVALTSMLRRSGRSPVFGGRWWHRSRVCARWCNRAPRQPGGVPGAISARGLHFTSATTGLWNPTRSSRAVFPPR